MSGMPPVSQNRPADPGQFEASTSGQLPFFMADRKGNKPGQKLNIDGSALAKNPGQPHSEAIGVDLKKIKATVPPNSTLVLTLSKGDVNLKLILKNTSSDSLPARLYWHEGEIGIRSKDLEVSRVEESSGLVELGSAFLDNVHTTTNKKNKPNEPLKSVMDPTIPAVPSAPVLHPAANPSRIQVSSSRNAVTSESVSASTTDNTQVAASSSTPHDAEPSHRDGRNEAGSSHLTGTRAKNKDDDEAADHSSQRPPTRAKPEVAAVSQNSVAMPDSDAEQLDIKISMKPLPPGFEYKDSNHEASTMELQRKLQELQQISQDRVTDDVAEGAGASQDLLRDGSRANQPTPEDFVNKNVREYTDSRRNAVNNLTSQNS